MTSRYALTTAALILTIPAAHAQSAPTVQVVQGTLAGAEKDGIASYKGIPYAAAPVGKLRWAAPAAPPSWSGVRKADAFAKACPQVPVPWFPPEPQSEDCLFLNVWTPAKAPGAKLPVMVWIHGGAYVGGSGSAGPYEGSSLTRKGVVLVTLNYRLGTLGFMAHPQATAESPLHSSGNYGLLDQIAALKWVRANIARFGGDPGNVTIFGESAGGGSVMLLTVSPLARGLFRRAISESGAALPPQPKGYARPDAVITLAQAEAAGVALQNKLGLKSLAEMRALSSDAVIKAGAPQSAMWPIADGKVVPDDVTKVYRAGRQLDVPILLGWNSAEGMVFAQPGTRADQAKAVRAAYGPRADAMLALYPAADDAAVHDANAAMFGDVAFGWPGWSLAEAQAGKGRSPVYLYHFDQVPPRPPGFPFTGSGALHADEIAYVFGTHDPAWPAADSRVSELMQGYWVNFARTGDPNGAALPRWQPYRSGGTALWFQGGAAKAGPVPREKELKALDAIVGG